ncbi:hypothetical protein CA600_17760 [Paenibacillus sp. VTT E-133280]|uniref:hypothetical protein n=1 Tax=unclassified Paenibacillus TaxID=185978 RepID=UPI000BA031D9|nr:hypothetical protein [Paenibacillus sp. VTT E-133280]OZQ64081.1 hypothetical protein CA600_17760 [Paenibacillus sp. VTT E-133280]
MKIEASKAVMLPMKSLAIWKSVNKQCVRLNSNLDIVNRLVKGMQVVIKRSNDEMSRSLNQVNQSLQDINDTLLEGFKRLPPKIVVSRDIVIEQSQQAGQSQQLALRTLSISPSEQMGKKEEEKAKKVNWWKGLKAKEKKKEEEKKPETKADPVPTPKINLRKEPPTPPSPPSPDSKIMKFLKTADVVKPFNAVKSLGEKAVKAAAEPEDIANWNKLNDNTDAALKKIGEKAMGALRPVMDTLNEALTSGQLMPIIDAMANGFLFIANVIGMVVNGILWLVGVVQENWSWIKPFLEAIAFVYLAAMIVQVYSLAAAWMVANWPILVVIAVIAALIYIFQLLGVSAGDVVGAIAGAFGWLKVYIQNVIIYWQNIFIIFKDFLQNLFIDPVYAIDKLFYDLAVNFLDLMYQMAVGAENFAGGFMKVVADAINKMLPGVKKLLDFLSNIPGFEGLANIKIDYITPEVPRVVSGMIKNMKGQLVAPTSNKAVKNTEKKEFLEYEDTVNAYTQKGKDFAGKFGDMGRKAKELIENPIGKINGSKTSQSGLLANQSNNLNTVNRVKQLDSINDTVDISSDDLKMLRELAEIQAIQNFVELTPTVQVTTGNINNAGDIDSIINKIGQKLNEEFVSTAQGVYT